MTDERPLLVLVHSPLVGPLTWSSVADHLRRTGGWTVVVPKLDNPDDAAVSLQRHHAQRIRRAIEAESATAPVVLVGHSGAGPILPAAGETIVNPVAGYVFVDTDLPRDGVARLDLAPPEFADRLRHLADRGRIPPWAEWWNDDVLETLLPDEAVREAFVAELAPLPVRLFEERLRVPLEWPDAPCAYLRLSAAYEGPATAAARQGWTVRHLERGHLHMLADPGAVADELSAMANGLTGRSDRNAERGTSAPPDDPVVAQRRAIARWVDRGRRVGFGALAVAIFLFAVALYWDLPGILVTTIIASLVVAAVTLLPSIIVGYGLAAADREDRERGRPARP